MTLEVGERYRGMWRNSPRWLGITRIDRRSYGTIIRYRVVSRTWPRILWWLCRFSSDRSRVFIQRIDDAVEYDRIEQELWSGK